MVVELFAQVDGGQSLTGAILFFSVSLLSVICYNSAYSYIKHVQSLKYEVSREAMKREITQNTDTKN